MSDTTQLDIEALLKEFNLDEVLNRTRTAVIDPGPKAEALKLLRAEERKLAAEAKAIDERRKVIRELIKKEIPHGIDNLVLIEEEGAEPAVIAKMSYPEPTTRVNTAYIKEHFPFHTHPEFWIRSESTPRLLVQP